MADTELEKDLRNLARMVRAAMVKAGKEATPVMVDTEPVLEIRKHPIAAVGAGVESVAGTVVVGVLIAAMERQEAFTADWVKETMEVRDLMAVSPLTLRLCLFRSDPLYHRRQRRRELVRVMLPLDKRLRRAALVAQWLPTQVRAHRRDHPRLDNAAKWVQRRLARRAARQARRKARARVGDPLTEFV